MVRPLVCVAALAAAAGVAQADVTVNFTAFTFTGFNFVQIYGAPDFLSGTLTAVSVNAVLNASVNDTWADDLTIYVDPLPLSGGGMLQVGGFSNLGAAERGSWANGASPLPGTPVSGTYSLINPISFAGNSSDPMVWLGNGYGSASTSGTWTGSVTLIGVNVVPAPAAAALLGLGSVAALRRRRK